MTMIIRFVIANEKKENVPANVSISEHFLTFIELHDTTGLNMTNVLLETLKKYGLLLDDMRGQGYDNGANMRGQQNGVQARVRQLNRRAFYVPCNAHSLNLVLNDTANCCLDAVIFFNIIQEVYVFFSVSTHRWNVLLKHINNLTVKPLSATRWESRLDAVRAIRFQVKEIYSALLEISQDNSLVNPSGVKSRAEAIGIINKFLSFKFLCCLVVWYDILFEINITSKMLQSISLDVSETVKQLDSTKHFLMRYRSDEGFENTLKSAKLLANELGIEDSFPSIDQSRIRRTNTQFNYESCDDPIIDSKQRFKVNFFNAILDRAIQSINERFLQLSEHANLFSFLYDISKIKNSDELMTHCKDLQLALASDDGLTSDIDAVELYDEITALQRRFNDTETNPRNVLEYICANQLVELFPNTYVSLRILLTLPVTAATGERSFSKLKIIKNYLRSQMSQDRLVGLAMISIEKELAYNMDMEEVVSDFANAKARKVKF